VFLLLKCSIVTKAQQVECEEIQTRRINDIGDELLKGCRMDEITVIDSADLTLVSEYDEGVTEMFGTLNKKIEFLPTKIYEKFPRLISLIFKDCALKSVTIDSLQKLVHMRKIDLSSNQIETFGNETFDDLKRLQYLYLNFNRISSLDGNVFKKLENLFIFEIKGNVCIDEDFYIIFTLPEVVEDISLKCSYKANYQSCLDNFQKLDSRFDACNGCARPEYNQAGGNGDISAIEGNDESSNKVECEDIVTRTVDDEQFLTSCKVDGTTIVTSEFNFAVFNETVTEIYADGNTNILFLPTNVYKIFPNLVSYVFSWCKISTVSRKNFRGLTQLTFLDISINQIKSIGIGTFEDLVNLKQLKLTYLEIKTLNGLVFKPLVNLQYLDLESNSCIDQEFDVTKQGLEKVMQIVSQNCSILEAYETCQANIQIAQKAIVACSCSQPEVIETTAATDLQVIETTAAAEPEVIETTAATDPEVIETTAATDPETSVNPDGGSGNGEDLGGSGDGKNPGNASNPENS
jgi:Leucine-rich repeat (LRR) protein